MPGLSGLYRLGCKYLCFICSVGVSVFCNVLCGCVMYRVVMQEFAADEKPLMTHHTAAATTGDVSLIIERQASYTADSSSMTVVDDELEMMSMPECQPPSEFTVPDPAMAADNRLLTGPSCSSGGTFCFSIICVRV